MKPNPKTTLNLRYSFENFVKDNSNSFAHCCAKAVVSNYPKTQHNPLFIYAGKGLGKTHLLHAIGNKIEKLSASPVNVLYITSKIFIEEFISSSKDNKFTKFKEKYKKLDCLLFDDVQFLEGKESAQEVFFDVFNVLYDLKKQIIIACDRQPSDLTGINKRLACRFEWGILCEILPPSLETRLAILRNYARRKELSLPEDVLLYTATKVQKNIQELQGTLRCAFSFAAFTGKPLSIDCVKVILQNTTEA
jgi:chromosomal replication initiator protein